MHCKLFSASLLLLSLLLVSHCGFAPKNPYPKAKTLHTNARIGDKEDVTAVAKKMLSELGNFPPIKTLSKGHRVAVIIDDIENNTRYKLNKNLFKDSVERTLYRTGKFEVIEDKTHEHYDLISQLDYHGDAFTFSIKLKDTKTGLLLWQDSINLRIKSG